MRWFFFHKKWLILARRGRSSPEKPIQVFVYSKCAIYYQTQKQFIHYWPDLGLYWQSILTLTFSNCQTMWYYTSCFSRRRYSAPITKLSLTYFIPFIYSTLISRLCSFSFLNSFKLYKSKPAKHGNACKRNNLGGTKDINQAINEPTGQYLSTAWYANVTR